MMPHPIRHGRPARTSASRRPSHIPGRPTDIAAVILLLEMDPRPREVAGDSGLDSLANASCQVRHRERQSPHRALPRRRVRGTPGPREQHVATVPARTDTNLAAGVRHIHRIRAINDTGPGHRSNHVNPVPWGRGQAASRNRSGVGQERPAPHVHPTQAAAGSGSCREDQGPGRPRSRPRLFRITRIAERSFHDVQICR